MRKWLSFSVFLLLGTASAWGGTVTFDVGGVPTTWTTTGDVTMVGDTTLVMADTSSWTFHPGSGSMAQLVSQGVDIVTLEASLILPSGTVDSNLGGIGFPWVGSGMTTVFNVDLGDVGDPIDVWVAFGTTDFASAASGFATLAGPGSTFSFTVLACGDLTCSSPQPGQGWIDYRITPTAVGSYTLGLGVVQPFDGNPPSYLFVDGVEGTVPEPVTLGLIGGGLALLSILRRRRA
jgi:hypothetical protein